MRSWISVRTERRLQGAYVGRQGVQIGRDAGMRRLVGAVRWAE
jgi:hypothetical protein